MQSQLHGPEAALGRIVQIWRVRFGSASPMWVEQQGP